MTQNVTGGDRLASRIVLITGAGSGLGRACALACAGQGATVVLLGRNIPDLEAVYDAIETQGGPQPAIYPMNLEGATLKDYDDLAVTLQDTFGRLDGLIHNAAELGTLTPLAQYDPETWARVLHVNLTAPFLLTQTLLPLLRTSSRASIICTSDRAGREARAYWGAYGVSKWGLEGFMGMLAEELAHTGTIRVNSVDPGPCRTRLREKAYPAENRDAIPYPDAVTPLFIDLLAPDGPDYHGERLTAPATATGQHAE